ncbi:MAG: hypothetical protein H7832_04915 [Magnetococcus sp. DMHC-6]
MNECLNKKQSQDLGGLHPPIPLLFEGSKTEVKSKIKTLGAIPQSLADEYLASGQYRQALHYALQAAQENPHSWQGLHRAALAMRLLGQLPQALQMLAKLHHRFPDIPEIRRDLGDFICKVLGDWQNAWKIWHPLQNRPEFKREMAWLHIKRQIYAGTSSYIKLHQEILQYASTYLTLPEVSSLPQNTTSLSPSLPSNPLPGKTRLRLGLISTFFRASPVYYLCFGAIRHLALEFDLIFFSRETIADWATDAFKELAYEWYEVKSLSPEALAVFLKQQHLDILVEMCGWLDLQALQAVSSRPARRVYKWIGGQSTTTGLTIFDGFISDVHQTPLPLQSLYSEPLILLPSGYATYTPPPYFPPPQRGSLDGGWQVGVIAHPMKISPPFLHYLRTEMQKLDPQLREKMSLSFIGWRYGHPLLQKRLTEALWSSSGQEGSPMQIKFLPTSGHEAFLHAVAALDWVIDTFPYTNGVTALESLALGVPLRTRVGRLFSERHAYSHCRFAGLTHAECDLIQIGAFTPPLFPKKRHSLLAKDCLRLNHVGVAQELVKVFNTE